MYDSLHKLYKVAMLVLHMYVSLLMSLEALAMYVYKLWTVQYMILKINMYVHTYIFVVGL